MARSRKKDDAARTLALLAARIAHGRNGQDIVALNLTGISPVTDYFVIFTGSSDRQMRAVGDEIVREAAAIGRQVYRTAGVESSQWIVLDFVDVVVHVFDQAHRRYYDLELIWGDAPRLRWRMPAARTADSKEQPREPSK